MSRVTKEIDPLTKALVQASFVNIADQAAEILEKAAISFILCEARDYCSALLDAKGRLVSVAEKGGAEHVGSAELLLKATLDAFGDDFQPGDVILQNDPYVAYGNHLPDWTFIRPIFVDKKLTFFAMLRGHQADTKGAFPGGYFPGGFDIHAEGLLIPPTRIIRRDAKEKVYDFILHNVRWPESVRIDNAAIFAGLKRMEEGVVELCRRYGRRTLLNTIDTLIQGSEKAIRAELSQWPDGTWEGESQVDRDGSGAENVTVRVALTKKGDELTVDLSKSDRQVTFVNSGLGCTYCMTYTGLTPRFSPDIVTNSGKFKPIKIIAPRGTVVNPKFPATIGACAVFVGANIVEAMQMAIGKVLPDKVDAGWAQHMAPIFIGHDPRSNESYWMVTFQSDGGSGASDVSDGCPNVAPVGPGGQLIDMPLELTEIKWPWRILKCELVTDSAGPGEYRGGLGISWLGLNEGGKALGQTGACSGENWAPFGQNGGKPGINSRIFCLRGGKEEYRPTIGNWTIEPGDIIGTVSSGGGGHGNPSKRPIERVKEDVINGYVSVKSAREDYGVVIDPKTFEVDWEATKALRGKK
jgi:N-methylhydantoinase B